MSGVRLLLSNVCFAYEGWSVRFDLKLQAGSFLAVIGPSGAGKSTLLNLIAGFERPSNGDVRVNEHSVTDYPPADRPVTMLFQENNLFAHLDLNTNVALGVSPALKLTADDRNRIVNAISRVGLSGMEHRLPGALSGGERQRAAIARALVRDQPLLLLDEPFAALGPALKADMLDLIGDIHRDTGVTIVMVTHDPQDARRAASHTAFLDGGEIVALAPTEELFQRQNVPGLANYLGS